MGVSVLPIGACARGEVRSTCIDWQSSVLHQWGWNSIRYVWSHLPLLWPAMRCPGTTAEVSQLILSFRSKSRVRRRWRAETIPRSGCWCNERVFSGCLVQQCPNSWRGGCAGDGAKTREVRKRAHLTFALQLCPLPHRSSITLPLSVPYDKTIVGVLDGILA